MLPYNRFIRKRTVETKLPGLIKAQKVLHHVKIGDMEITACEKTIREGGNTVPRGGTHCAKRGGKHCAKRTLTNDTD